MAQKTEYGVLVDVSHLPHEALRTITRYPYTTDLCKTATASGLSADNIFTHRGLEDLQLQQLIREAVAWMDGMPLPGKEAQIANCFHVLFDCFPNDRIYFTAMCENDDGCLFNFSTKQNRKTNQGIAPPNLQEETFLKKYGPGLPQSFDITFDRQRDNYSVYPVGQHYAEHCYDAADIAQARMKMVLQVVGMVRLPQNRELPPSADGPPKRKP